MHRSWQKPLLTLGALAVAVLVSSCTTSRDAAPSATEADVVLAFVDGGMDAEVADCVVGLASREFDVDRLQSADLVGDDALLLDEMVRSCEDAIAILAEEDLAPRTTFDTGPFNVGDDQYLDELWYDCEAGRGAACDQLWREAPVGSIYESFGVTCGDRPEVLDCTLEMDGPNRTPAAAR